MDFANGFQCVVGATFDYNIVVEMPLQKKGKYWQPDLYHMIMLRIG